MTATTRSAVLRHPAVQFGTVTALAWAVRAIYLVEISDQAFFHLPLVDAGQYLAHAQALAGGGPPRPDLVWQPWFLPAVLSWVIRVFGEGLWTLKLFQITGGALVCGAAAGLARTVGGQRVGWIAGVMCAFYGPLIHYDGEFLAASWAALWLTLTAWLALSFRNAPRMWKCAVYGALGALCLFTRPPLMPAWLIAAMAMVPPRPSFAALAANRIGLALAGFLAAALPFLVVAHQATGSWRGLPDSGPVNLYIGNSADPCATINIRPGYAWESLMVWPDLNGAHSAGARKSFYTRKTLEDIRSHPATFAGNLVAKAAQFFSSREIPRNTEVYTFREYSRLLAATVWRLGPVGFPFGIVFGLALVGLAAHRGRPVLLVSMALVYAASIIAIHVCDRYRIPALPLLLVFAALGVEALWRQPSVRLAGLLAAGIALSSVAGPFCAERLNYRAELHRLIATEAYDRGRLDLAEAEAGDAIRANPRETQAINQLGLVHAQRGDLAGAEVRFREALAIDPAMPLAWFNLGKIEAGRGNLEVAVHLFEEGLQRMPGHLPARIELAGLYAQTGRGDLADAQYRRVLEIRPGYPPALRELKTRSSGR